VSEVTVIDAKLLALELDKSKTTALFAFLGFVSLEALTNGNVPTTGTFELPSLNVISVIDFALEYKPARTITVLAPASMDNPVLVNVAEPKKGSSPHWITPVFVVKTVGCAIFYTCLKITVKLLGGFGAAGKHVAAGSLRLPFVSMVASSKQFAPGAIS